MQIFAVTGMLPEQQEAIVSLAVAEFGRENIYEAEGVCFLSTELALSTQTVAKKLGIADDKNDYQGVVINAKFNWGYHDEKLWEWMALRSDGNGK